MSLLKLFTPQTTTLESEEEDRWIDMPKQNKIKQNKQTNPRKQNKLILDGVGFLMEKL